jgi:hypothetical protein
VAGVYLIQDDKLTEMTEHSYDSEDLLQALLAKYPSLLAGDQIDSAEPRKWILVSREAPIPSEEDGSPRWSIDHVFLDQDGIPTLVEVKRSTDSRIRREVVGQMLDYAANALAYWPVEAIRAAFETRCTTENRNAQQVLADYLGPATNPDSFWQKVKTNLQAGKVRLVFVADEVPSELRRVVEFLNQQMDPAEVLAVEIRQYVSGNLKTLVPRLLGQTEEAQQKKSASRGKVHWDEKSFLQELEKRCGSDDAHVARNILEWVRQTKTGPYWGVGKRDGSFVPWLDIGDWTYQLFAVWTYGRVEIYFKLYGERPAFSSEQSRRQLLSKLNEFLSDKIPEEAITGKRWPSIPLSALRSPHALDAFRATFDWFIEEAKAKTPR